MKELIEDLEAEIELIRIDNYTLTVHNRSARGMEDESHIHYQCVKGGK